VVRFLGVPKTARLTSSLSSSQEDYVKALYKLRHTGHGVSTSELAEHLHVSAPSVSEMFGKLAALGLVSHDRYRGAELTERGEAVAVEMIRHHRLLEMYLVKALGYSWDEVHEEAERLEHVISEQFEERIAAALGRPRRDPHGDPIPSERGDLEESPHTPLTACAAGDLVRVRRVSDSDPDKLRAIGELGLWLGADVEVLEPSRYEGPITVRLGRRLRQIPLGLAREVFVGD